MNIPHHIVYYYPLKQQRYLPVVFYISSSHYVDSHPGSWTPIFIAHHHIEIKVYIRAPIIIELSILAVGQRDT